MAFPALGGGDKGEGVKRINSQRKNTFKKRYNLFLQ